MPRYSSITTQLPPPSPVEAPITLSNVKADDFEALVAIRIAAMRESLARIGRFDPERARERFLLGFEPDNTHHIVAKGQRIGFVVTKPTADALHLDHLYILPAWQGQGIGAAVLQLIVSEANALGLPIRVGALRESASNRFYVRHGFELVEQAEFDNYYIRVAQKHAMTLVRPAADHLPSYVAALERGWSADNLRGAVAAAEELLRIQTDAAAFINSMEDREAKGPPVTLPDGSVVNRIPGFRRWLWDGEFCGSIGLRWQPGTTALPPHCLGHIGYAVVPWKQGKGYAKSALGQLLPLAKDLGLPFVEITTDPDNTASQRVILANGGYLVEKFNKPPQFGGKPGLRFRITLA